MSTYLRCALALVVWALLPVDRVQAAETLRFEKSVHSSPGQGYWRTYDVRDGLAGDEVWAVLQDRQGYMWFGTASGLSRFDGEEFSNFTAPHALAGNGVWLIHQDRSGYLWFATEGGLSRFDGERFENFGRREGLAGEQVNAILEDQAGYMWFATEEGVSRFDGQEFTSFNTEYGMADNRVVAMLQSRSGHIWFATPRGLSRYDGQLFTNFTTKAGLADDRVQALFEDRAGRLWFGTQRGIGMYDGEEFTSFGDAGATQDPVVAIAQDHKGALWFASRGGGVYGYDGGHWTELRAREGLASDEVVSIFEDGEGRLWFGTWNSGLSRYDGEYLQSFPTGGLRALPNQICEDREGYVWFGTDDGLYRYAGRSWTSYTRQDIPVDHRVHSALRDGQGRLWFGGQGGVSAYDGRQWTHFAARKGSEALEMRALCTGGGERVWFGTDQGLYRYEGDEWTAFTTADGLADNRVYAGMTDARGRTWFGTGAGVSVYDGRQWKTFSVRDGLGQGRVRALMLDREEKVWAATEAGVSVYDGRQWKTFTTEEGLADNWVQALLQDRKGGIWVATEAGVSVYDGRQWKTFTTEEGLAHNRVQCLFEDSRGRLWFGTARNGVSLYDGRVFQTLKREDGLAGNGVWAMVEDAQGQLWFAAGSGISRFRPPAPVPPAIFLDAVIADRRYAQVDSLALPSNLGVVAFAFHGISMKTRPEGMIYRYRLKGYDQGWRMTRTRLVEYQDLPTGEYTFEVRAVDRDLVYSSSAAGVALEMHFPRQWIAWIAGFGLALGLIVWQSARVVQRDRRLRAGAEAELQRARALQTALMPREEAGIEGFDFRCRCIPARQMGGDFFQYFHCRQRRAFALAGAGGRGMDAAISMLVLNGMLKIAMQRDDPLEQVCVLLNRMLCETPGRGRGAHLVLGELEPGTGLLHLVLAGCIYAFHFQTAGGEVVELKAGSAPVGLAPENTYREREIHLDPGDRLVICSKGVVEAADSEGELYGCERLLASIGQGCAEDFSSTLMLRWIIGEVKGFTRRAPQGDDQMLAVLKRQRPG